MGSSHPRKPRGYQPGRCNIFERAIFSGESLPQELTEPVPEAVEYRPADWAEKYFSAQSAMRSRRVTLLPSYTKQFSSLIDLVAWPVQREDCSRFQNKKYSTKPRKSQALTWGLRTNTLPSIFSANLSKVYLILVANVRDFYAVVFGKLRGKLVQYPRLLIISPRSLNNF